MLIYKYYKSVKIEESGSILPTYILIPLTLSVSYFSLILNQQRKTIYLKVIVDCNSGRSTSYIVLFTLISSDIQHCVL